MDASNRLEENATSNFRFQALLAVVLAVAFATLRTPGVATNQNVTLMADSLIESTSLDHSPWVLAAFKAPYTLGPKLAAYGIAMIASFVPWPVGVWVWILLILTWVCQAFLMFRLARSITGDLVAAFLATVLFGFDAPMFLSDSPYSLQWLERSLGMVPLLWGICALVEGKRWTAWTGVGLSLYMHANPAMYLWPVLALEELRYFYKDRSSRSGVCLRFLCAIGLGLPLLYAVLNNRPSHEESVFAHLAASMAVGTGGRHLCLADRLFMTESFILTLVAAYKMRSIPGWHLLMRIAMVCMGFLIVGAVTQFEVFFKPNSLIWNAAVHIQPWLALFLMEIVGLLLVSAWLSLLMKQGEAVWPLLLFFLSLAYTHDLILRGLAAFIALSLAFNRPRVALGAATLPPVLIFLKYLLSDVLFKFIHAAGLRGGFLSSAAFQLPTGLIVLLCVGTGLGLNNVRHAERFRRTALCAVALFLTVAAWTRRASGTIDLNTERLAVWSRAHVPANASILASPVDLLPCLAFMARAEREIFACKSYLVGPLMFGKWGIPMTQRLKELGIEAANIRDEESYNEEIGRADSRLDPERVIRIAKAHPGLYLLLRSNHPWPWTPVRIDGDLVLYKIP